MCASLKRAEQAREQCSLVLSRAEVWLQSSETDLNAANSGVSLITFYSHLWTRQDLNATGRGKVPFSNRLGAALFQMVSLLTPGMENLTTLGAVQALASFGGLIKGWGISGPTQIDSIKIRISTTLRWDACIGKAKRDWVSEAPSRQTTMHPL